MREINHDLSDKALSCKILLLSQDNLANLYRITSENDRCLCFKICYAPEEFFLSLVEINQIGIGWFIKDGFLYVYKGVKND